MNFNKILTFQRKNYKIFLKRLKYFLGYIDLKRRIFVVNFFKKSLENQNKSGIVC